MKLFDQYKGLRKENYVLFFGRIVTNMGAMIYPVMTLILNQKMGLAATQVALITVISGLLILPAGIIGGKVADKFNKKKCIIVCDIVSIILFIICGLLPLSFFSIALLLVAASFQNAEDPIYTALIADITYTENRDKAYSLMYLGANIGLIASPTIAGILFKNYLWLSFIISGVAIACSTTLIFFKVKDISKVEESSAEAEYQADREGESLFKILSENKAIMLFTIGGSIFWALYSQYGYMLPLELGRVHGENGALIYGSVASLNCIVVVICTPFFTKLLEKMTQTWKNVVGVLLVLLGYAVFLLSLGVIPGYYVAMTLFTFGEIVSTLASGPYVSNRVPASHRGRINGFMGFGRNFIYGVMMMFIGLLYDHTGNVSAWLLIFGGLIISAIMGIVLIGLDKREYPNLYSSIN